MKDSQLKQPVKWVLQSISKANNERFSTSHGLCLPVGKYIKGE